MGSHVSNVGMTTTVKITILPSKAGNDPTAIPQGQVVSHPTTEAGKTSSRESGETVNQGMPHVTQVGLQATKEKDILLPTMATTIRTA